MSAESDLDHAAASPQPVPEQEDAVSLLFRLGIGPWLFPLMGKLPIHNSWPDLPAATEAEVRDWIDIGYNLGFRTGAKSGLVVVDNDQPKHGLSTFVPAPTGLIAASPTGSRHYYYKCPSPEPHNSANSLAPYVDVRGWHGFVVVPPSVHPIAKRSYAWEATGEPGVFPTSAVHEKSAHEKSEPALDMSRPEPVRGNGYADTALLREVARVQIAAEGSRNDTLNRASFNLGQLVGGGALSEATVKTGLLAAAKAAGLTEAEAKSTIRSGFNAGVQKPRRAPARNEPPTHGTEPTPDAAPDYVPREASDVLVPGSHVTPHGEYVEQGTNTFAQQVLGRIDPETLYRRAAMLGEIIDGQFVPVSSQRLRSIVDSSVRLVASKETEDKVGDPVNVFVFRPCSSDHSAVVLDYGAACGQVRNLVHLATHPVCLGRDFAVAKPGWNPIAGNSGAFLCVDSVPDPLPLDEARAVLADLVCDFPFQDKSDRANFFGLLLTPLLRLALDEPVPMHLIGSPMERTGKTKLAEVVLGVSISGRRTPAMQLGEREEEREKRILSVLLRGQGLLHLDNLSEFLDSPSLASLLTSSEYQGRLLGQSAAPSIPNGLTVVGTGNNVHATGEIAKRIVPIRLLPGTGSPETRQDFRHPDLYGYVLENRQRVLGALLGLVAHWRASGGKFYPHSFGGFERWTAVVGGILNAAGYPEWLTNRDEWRGEVDDSDQEHKALIGEWFRRNGHAWTPAADIYRLAVEMDLYGWLDRFPSERAKRTSFGMRVMNRLTRRVFGTLRVESDGVGERRRLRLADISEAD